MVIDSRNSFRSTVEYICSGCNSSHVAKLKLGWANYPIDTTLWTNGYDLTGVAVMDGLTMTVGAWTSGSYVTGAYLIGGASNQDLWGHLTYLLP